MSLNPEFRDGLILYLKSDVLPILKNFESDKRIKQIFRYQNPYDFHMGWTWGKMYAIVIGNFKDNYKRDPTDDEFIELGEICIAFMIQVKKILKQKTDKNPDF